FPKVGLCGADMGAAYLLPPIVGRGRAAELLYFGDLVDASAAQAMGLANRVLPPDEVVPFARGWARRLAEGPAFAHAMTKQMLDHEAQMSLVPALEAEAQAQAICMAHPDFRTAYDANQAETTPRFRGAPEGEG
ncbi:MAG: enoyl-CoA hydratase-related protein, partial [Myxococcota bacterium]